VDENTTNEKKNNLATQNKLPPSHKQRNPPQKRYIGVPPRNHSAKAFLLFNKLNKDKIYEKFI